MYSSILLRQIGNAQIFSKITVNVHLVYDDVMHQIGVLDFFSYMIKFLVILHFNSGINAVRVSIPYQISDCIEV